MDDSQPQRRPFRFSLRRLILWAAVCAAYVGALRWWGLAYLRALEVPNPLSVCVCLTAYLAILLPIRIAWGAQRGAQITVLGTLLVLACLAEISIVVNRLTGQSSGTLAESQWVLLPFFHAGIFLSAIGFVFVHTLVIAVDWIDGLMQTKPRQDP